MRPARFVALDQMCAWADAGETESGGYNRSPLIDKLNRDAGVPVGSSYCATAIHGAFKVAGIDDFGGPACASVEQTLRWADGKGWLKTRPFAGDVGGWYLDGDSWADHEVMVAKVRSWGGLLFTLDTVEANTSSGDQGSQADGPGFHRRRRTVRRGTMKFVRDPRKATKDPFKPKPKRNANRKRLKTLRAWILKRRKEGWTWARLKKTANWREAKRRGLK